MPGECIRYCVGVGLCRGRYSSDILVIRCGCELGDELVIFLGCVDVMVDFVIELEEWCVVGFGIWICWFDVYFVVVGCCGGVFVVNYGEVDYRDIVDI